MEYGTVSEYPKIETLYDRDSQTFRVDPSKVRLPEFGLISEWLVTEKIDGTNVRIRFDVDPDGSAATVAFRGRTDAAQMPPTLLAHLDATFEPHRVANAFEPGVSGWLYGEGYGPKIQKSGGNYRSDGPSFRLFDVCVGEWWLNWPDVEDVAGKLGIQTVPVLARTLSLDDAASYVHGSMSMVATAENDGVLVEGEGVVARTDPLLFDRRGNRLMWKLKGRDFKGGGR